MNARLNFKWTHPWKSTSQDLLWMQDKFYMNTPLTINVSDHFMNARYKLVWTHPWKSMCHITYECKISFIWTQPWKSMCQITFFSDVLPHLHNNNENAHKLFYTSSQKSTFSLNHKSLDCNVSTLAWAWLHTDFFGRASGKIELCRVYMHEPYVKILKFCGSGLRFKVTR